MEGGSLGRKGRYPVERLVGGVIYKGADWW
jgi:hypothetical protein